jgi:ribulose-5-phosphate 4-epimerase/fuculose-1-phosphate aldolase
MHSTTRQVIDELQVATRILVGEGVLDGFGHVSARNPAYPDHYFMLRNNSPAEGIEAGSFVELDAQSEPLGVVAGRPSIERFIHGEIYRSRPDVHAVVHSHSPHLVAFAATGVPLRPLYHMCGFLGGGAPVFDIADEFGMTDMLITNRRRGESLVAALGASALVLMRGHGATVVGASIKEAVFRAIYGSVNARIQPVVMQLGVVKFLAPEEAALTDELHRAVVERPWNHWKEKYFTARPE